MGRDGADDPLDARELLIAERMLKGDGPREIERVCEIPHTTAWRIMSRPKVVAFVRAAQEQAGQALIRRATSMAGEALAELRTIGMDANQPASARVSALGRLLDIAAPRRIEATGAGGGPIEVSTDQARELIRAQLAATPAADLGMPEPDDVDEEG